MKVSEIKFGAVVYNTDCECYARVIGFIEEKERIFIQVRSGPASSEKSTTTWNPNCCRELTSRERGDSITAVHQLDEVIANMEREV